MNRALRRTAAAVAASDGGTVWVQDYQLQLVPKMLRELRPDLTIGFFNHIPFPAYGIFSQLPWRTQIIEGLLGADVIGFQRAARRGQLPPRGPPPARLQTKGTAIDVPVDAESRRHAARHRSRRARRRVRTVVARHFPISIDAQSFEDLAQRPDIQARAQADPRRPRQPEDDHARRRPARLHQGHRPPPQGLRRAARRRHARRSKTSRSCRSRARAASASQPTSSCATRSSCTVGRINGDFGTIGHTAISYLHHGYPREEMVALYLAADVMLVTALRDGMNLVAKEYVATRFDNDGVLVLSEFAGAADELKQALLVNPHDIEGLKDAILEADPHAAARARRRGCARCASACSRTTWRAGRHRFLDALASTRAASHRSSAPGAAPTAVERRRPTDGRPTAPSSGGSHLGLRADDSAAWRDARRDRAPARRARLRRHARARGRRPRARRGRCPRRASAVLRAARRCPGPASRSCPGRAIESLEQVAELPDDVLLVGSHGVEIRLDGPDDAPRPRRRGARTASTCSSEVLEDVAGRLDNVWIEPKPAGFALHTRLATDDDSQDRAPRSARRDARPRSTASTVREGKNVLEFSVRSHDQGRGASSTSGGTPRPTAVFYAGDDVTDEDAFARARPRRRRGEERRRRDRRRLPGRSEAAAEVARVLGHARRRYRS